MNNLTLKKGAYVYSLNIDYIKYCIGFKFHEKYRFKQILKECVGSSKTTEYSIEHIGLANMYMNNQKMNNKDILFYEVTTNFSIQEELKLSSKSLIAKYLETLLSQEEYIDTINSINILLESFGTELDNEVIISRFITYTPKLFLKILLPIYCFENEQANEYDLDYNQIILFQLRMINFISQNNRDKKLICLLDIPILTIEIEEYLKSINNCMVIVLTTQYEFIPNMKDVYLFDDVNLDLSNDEEIYNVFLDKGIFTLKEAKEKMSILLKEFKEKLDMSILNIK